jgi:hypothetical protein
LNSIGIGGKLEKLWETMTTVAIQAKNAMKRANNSLDPTALRTADQLHCQTHLTNMIDPKMRIQIESSLGETEASESIWIIYACESGSRAWGFPSQDRDYDVRFIYHHSIEWYLAVDCFPFFLDLS